ncbi:hypothetical protein E2C01_010239 [Portunus trituberculatus]|uniref:Uncharacterized protein n=1 Tax=Portunus trituberculatus TaxID=210409 RepID=A0A5B7D7Y4_PORTR|nr:hypothetical protein [Portunus trituberculatus]
MLVLLVDLQLYLRCDVTEYALKVWSPDIEKMLQLVREKEHIWDPKNELYGKKESLSKLSFNEIAATLQELFPSMQGVFGGED